jgi:hypothetical protein
MNSQSQLISSLNPQYFWDVEISGLNDNKACRLIVERVFTLGDMHEMNEVIHFYGEKKTLELLCNISYIDPKSFNFILKLFHKPAKEFKCYQRKQSNPQYWNL